MLKSIYCYDTFGNRISRVEKQITGEDRTTTYQYNMLNQLVHKDDANEEETYTYDRRGNLSQIMQNGQVKAQYLYGAMNRLEGVRNQKGEIAQYI